MILYLYQFEMKYLFWKDVSPLTATAFNYTEYILLWHFFPGLNDTNSSPSSCQDSKMRTSCQGRIS